MKTAFTPGPYRVDTTTPELIIRKDNWGLARVIDQEVEGGSPEANARLFAAAPEMLEALEFTLSRCKDGGGPTLTLDVHNKIKDAIAKARGAA